MAIWAPSASAAPSVYPKDVEPKALDAAKTGSDIQDGRGLQTITFPEVRFAPNR